MNTKTYKYFYEVTIDGMVYPFRIADLKLKKDTKESFGDNFDNEDLALGYLFKHLINSKDK